jgi:hypothetical protein
MNFFAPKFYAKTAVQMQAVKSMLEQLAKPRK